MPTTSLRSGLLRLIAILLLALPTLAGIPAPTVAQEVARDLAQIPATPDQLPEAGYQLEAGSTLDIDEVAAFLATDRGATQRDVRDLLRDADWQASYAQRLVLLSDRAIATSPSLATIVTIVSAFADEDAAADAAVELADFAENSLADVTSADDDAGRYEIEEATSQERRRHTIVVEGDLVIEVISGDASRWPNADDHDAVVATTLANVDAAAEGGLLTSSLLVKDQRLVPPLLLEGAGLTWQVYRVRGGETIPAIGEVRAPDADDLAEGVTDLVLTQQTIELASGSYAIVSGWLGRFGDDATARAFADDPAFDDPLRDLILSENIGATNDAGIAALAGEMREVGRFSGYQQIVRDGDTVGIVQVRVTGTTRVAEGGVALLGAAQRACLTEGGACARVDFAEVLAVPIATPAATASEDGVFASGEFGWSLDYGSLGWKLTETLVEPGYDYIELQSGVSQVTIESVVDHHGDPLQCNLDTVALLEESEEHAYITAGSDDDAEASEGEVDDHVWSIWTVEPLADERSDQEYTIRIDCYTLVPGESSLVVQAIAPRYQWEDARDTADELREEIVFP